MSTNNVDIADRPEYDKVIQDIAEYVINYNVESDKERKTACVVGGQDSRGVEEALFGVGHSRLPTLHLDLLLLLLSSWY